MATPCADNTNYAWHAHPARQRPTQAVLALGIIVMFAAAVLLTVQSMIWAAGAALLLVCALNRFFLPSRFVIDETGITARYPFKSTYLPWASVRRAQFDAYGGYLSDIATPSRLDAFRGMHLLFDDERDRVIELIRQHMREHERSHDASSRIDAAAPLTPERVP